MSPPRLVNDYTGILNQNQFRHLEQKLENFNDSSSTQIVVAIVKSLNGLTKEEQQQLAQLQSLDMTGMFSGVPETEALAFLAPSLGRTFDNQLVLLRKIFFKFPNFF
jgi:uncharacterized protein YoaH (UPF0181 family)